MPNIAIWFGRLLILLGIIGYGYAVYFHDPAKSEGPSWTALIPAIIGLVLMVLGHISNAKENLRKHLMHAAVLIGVIGFVVPLFQIIRGISKFTLDFKAVLLISMTVLCLAFVVLCVKSFMDARKAV
jgi:peptidoglycan/LPS O-acetylase OafA/YrhL